MKAKTLQIIWHSKDPVFSIDFHPDGYIATGGGDKDIKVSLRLLQLGTLIHIQRC
jgi:chromatin assembly factor 1 subunit B